MGAGLSLVAGAPRGHFVLWRMPFPQKPQAQIQDSGLQTILCAEASAWHFLNAVSRGCLKGLWPEGFPCSGSWLVQLTHCSLRRILKVRRALALPTHLPRPGLCPLSAGTQPGSDLHTIRFSDTVIRACWLPLNICAPPLFLSKTASMDQWEHNQPGSRLHLPALYNDTWLYHVTLTGWYARGDYAQF